MKRNEVEYNYLKNRELMAGENKQVLYLKYTLREKTKMRAMSYHRTKVVPRLFVLRLLRTFLFYKRKRRKRKWEFMKN